MPAHFIRPSRRADSRITRRQGPAAATSFRPVGIGAWLRLAPFYSMFLLMDAKQHSCAGAFNLVPARYGQECCS
jgi:hypothetical protein